jgi:hypothetical protein
MGWCGVVDCRDVPGGQWGSGGKCFVMACIQIQHSDACDLAFSHESECCLLGALYVSALDIDHSPVSLESRDGYRGIPCFNNCVELFGGGGHGLWGGVGWWGVSALVSQSSPASPPLAMGSQQSVTFPRCSHKSPGAAGIPQISRDVHPQRFQRLRSHREPQGTRNTRLIT